MGQLGRQRFAMVHAAVHPDWSLAELERRVRRVEARLAAPDRREAIALLAADPARDPDRDLLGRVTQCRSVTTRGRLVGGAAGRRARGLAPALVGARP